jgi:toxin ParE1/3/4
MRIVRSEKAKQDLLQIWSYLFEHSPRAADGLVETVDVKLKTLAHLPFIGRDRSSLAPGLRSLVVHPYVLFYTVENDAITLVRVIDGRRDIDAEFRR